MAKKRGSGPSERLIQNQIMAWLLGMHDTTIAWEIYNQGIWSVTRGVYKQTTAFRPPGIPDIIGMHRGRAFWLEVKTPTGRCSEAQTFMHARLLKHGWPGCVVRSLAEAQAFLKHLEALK